MGAFTAAAMIEIKLELERQRDELGWTQDHDDGHDPWDWYMILQLRLGKLLVELERDQSGQEPLTDKQFRKRMAQVGAIATAAIEALDRKDMAE